MDEHATEQADVEGLVLRDKARMLYAHGGGGLAMTAITSLLLAFMVQTPVNRRGLAGWAMVMIAVLVMRTVDLLLWHPRRLRRPCRGASEIRCYATGVGAAASVWIAFPLLFFSSMSETGRAGAAVVLAAMAGGSPIMLGAVRGLATGYCLALILPFSLMFLFQPGRVNETLGTLGLFDAVVMTGACQVLHDRVMAFIRLARSHQLLMADAILQQARTQASNLELQAVQVALHDANQSLESRIEARTADLQREILERKSYARALARLASTDALTGLLNRATLSERLAELLQQAARNGTGLAVLFLDLDGFKQINDLQGHWIGDRVLRVAAERLATACVGAAGLARWGGDEFVIVTTGVSTGVPGEDGALALGHAIRNALMEPIDTGPRNVKVGVSVGIALYPTHGASQDELIRAADVAMYAGKKAGGGRVTLSDPRLARIASELRLLEQGFRDAPDEGALAVYYQPIVDTVGGRCDVMEALLRWTHPELGEIEPAVFVPVAERSEQIVALGRSVLLEACTAAMLWPGPDPPAVAVNVSIAQITLGDLLDDVQAALDASGLPVHRLQLEVTESVFVCDHARIMPVLQELQARGVRLVLDDFGSGVSSLGRLGQLPIGTIKIDKAIVHDQGEASLAIIRAMLLIAQAMRLHVVAEGVETAAQSAMLRKLGVTRLQGYLLCRPMPAASVPDWLLSRTSEPGAAVGR